LIVNNSAINKIYKGVGEFYQAEFQTTDLKGRPKNKRDLILTLNKKVIRKHKYYKRKNRSFRGLNEGIRHFQGVPCGKATIIAQKTVSLQLTNFHMRESLGKAMAVCSILE